MSCLVYCLLLILCLHASNARHLGVLDTELYDQKYHISGKGWVQDRVKRGEHKKSSCTSNATPSLSNEIEGTQGNEITSSPQVILLEVAKIEEWKRQSRRTLLEPSRDTEEIVDLKKNDDVVEDLVVMDYAQSHRKSPIHNRVP